MITILTQSIPYVNETNSCKMHHLQPWTIGNPVERNKTMSQFIYE